jgi:hypothetical protein
MTKLCPRGKAAAKRKFSVYPSAYANAYASKICAGKIKDPSGKKRKDFKGPKPMNVGGSVKKDLPQGLRKDTTTSSYGDAGKGRPVPSFMKVRPGQNVKGNKGREVNPFMKKESKLKIGKRKKMMSGGDAKVKKVAKALHKASGLHKQQAKTLDTISRVRGGGIAIKGLNFQGVK